MSRLSALLVIACLFTVPVAAQPARVERIAYDYTALYEALNPAIVKVFADSASGSGFLVSNTGLIATNHHVVRNARWTAVQFADGRKHAASIVVLDPRYDVAILKVHPSVVENITPLRLLPADREATLRAGIPVVAFGSPLSQSFLMTQGIVSKVETGTLLGDFLIQPGNSGGPLVNLEGEVVGINTFAEGHTSGAVRVTILRGVLSRPEVTQDDTPAPSPEPLPVLAATRYPTEVLKEKILSEPLDQKAYTLDAGKFTITAITPVLVGKLQIQEDLTQAANRLRRRGKKMKGGYDPVDAPFYEWHRSATSLLDFAVTFEVKPDFGTTAGSKWALFAAALASGAARTPMATPHQNFEFKAEFLDLRLYRDGELVQPITPGRSITEASLTAPGLSFVDEAYSGMYVYAPEVFATGSEYRLEVFDAREPSRPHKVITLKADSKLISQIRSDFNGLLEHQ
ncbi:MAG TPA: trypsin-like peptidase domain-containing protein [Vicinamibacterales bacterium]